MPSYIYILIYFIYFVPGRPCWAPRPIALTAIPMLRIGASPRSGSSVRIADSGWSSSFKPVKTRTPKECTNYNDLVTGMRHEIVRVGQLYNKNIYKYNIKSLTTDTLPPAV